MGNVKDKFASRYPSLQHEPVVMGVYLQLFLNSQLTSFLVPLDAKAFAVALSRELQNCIIESRISYDGTSNDDNCRSRNKIQKVENNEKEEKCVLKMGRNTVTDTIVIGEKEISTAIFSSTGRYSCIIHLCISHLLEHWSYELSIGIWCEVLGPALLSNLKVCHEELRKISSYFLSISSSSTSSSGISSTHPSSTSSPSVQADLTIMTAMRNELIQSCASCLVAFSRYLRAYGTFLPYETTDMISGYRKNDIRISNALTGSNTIGDFVVADALGPGCSQFLQASASILSDIVFESLSLLCQNSEDETCNISKTNEFSLGGDLHESSVSSLNAATALLATISLLLAEGAHIERVRLREVMSRQEEILPTAILALNEVMKNQNIEDAKMSTNLPNSSINSIDVPQKSDQSNQNTKILSPVSPVSPSTPCTALTETAKRLDISRTALRENDNRLLAALVSCCQVKIAEKAPKATLCAICALHLLIGMESDDDSDPESYSIFSAFRSPHRKEVSLVDILCHFGLPNILLETAIMQLEAHAASTNTSDCTVVNGEYSLKDGVLISLKAKSDRWATHPLFTTDRFIRSNTEPVQFLPSSRVRSESGEHRELSIETAAIQSVPTVINGILGESEDSLLNGFNSILKINGKYGKRVIEMMTLSQRGTVARECSELLRLIAICPCTNANEGIPKSLSSGTLPAFPTTQDSKNESSKLFPVDITDVLVSKLNKPIGPSLEQLLSAPMLYIMMTDVSLFLSVLSTQVGVYRPLVLWNASMRKDLLNVLCTENAEYANILSRYDYTRTATSPTSLSPSECGNDSTGDTNILPNVRRTAESTPSHLIPLSPHRAALHSHLHGECLIDNVYIKFLVPPGLTETEDQQSENQWSEIYRDDIGVRDLARFVEYLQTSISSNKLVIEHISRTGGIQSTGSGTSQLNILRAHLSLKERVLTQMLAHHDELGYAYADLYLDAQSLT